MFRNYLKTACRHLWRNKLYSSINIIGLTLAITCALLAVLYVQDEMSYDRFHKNAPHLYRLTTTIINADKSSETVGTTGQVEGPAFKSAIPEIADYVRIMGMNGINLSAAGKSLAVNNIFADENFFHIFSFPLLYGNPNNVLNDPFSIVLSEATALKFFGTTQVVGRTLQIEEGRGFENLTITGVAKNAPSNSSVQFDVIVPFKYLQKMFTDANWLNQYLTTFILLQPNTNPKTVEQKFAKVFEVNANAQLIEAKGFSGQYQFGLMPFTYMHLHPLALNAYGTTDEEQGLSDASTLTYSYILMGIVAFILIMACVNFINLSVAESLKKAKEIGVRKISGSTRIQIISQFLVEAAMLCFISFIFAAVLCNALLPVFNQLAEKKISFSLYNNLNLFKYGILLMLTCVFGAGLYPAFILSLFNPAQVLYNKQKLGSKNFFGKSLIVLQFTLALSLMISVIVYYRQMNFISNEDLGYNDADIIKIHLPPQRTDANVIAGFRNQLLKNPSIQQVASDMETGINSIAVNGKEIAVRTNSIDEFYLPALQIALKEGRNFSKEYGTDSVNAAIVNETFVKDAGWKNPINQQFTDLNDKHIKTVIGVVKDYHYSSLKQKIEPQVLSMGNREYVLIKIQADKIFQALKIIETTYNNTFPNHYFYYQFLNDENAASYKNDKRWQQIISYASSLAILICCVGLFGLSVFTSQQRYKEIGVRKVLGASVSNIVILLSKDFIRLVIIAFVIASPVAWYIMQNWLQGFAYRINISWWIFFIAGLLAVVIALATVSFQSIKAAIANPVKSLRTE